MHQPFNDDAIAELYDLEFRWAREDDYYLDAIMNSERVLDIGCGTGRMLHAARDRGFSGRLVGIDPAESMLRRARRRPDIEWYEGYAPDFAWRDEFDLVFMTGHAFQYLLSDTDIAATLGAVATFLSPGGRFVFETRNPADRAWERWAERYSTTVTTSDGAVVDCDYTVDPITDERWISTTTVNSSAQWEEPVIMRQTLRFVTVEELDDRLRSAGLKVVHRYGDWDLSPMSSSSPEIITVAERGR
ncbi:class I SAM-dependent methyltransferase [Haloglycomyces albus]|uniref:class I SAM-dependent methyltransferase n=1 Tax=Haloglycomyces albus TaxID=526067 RepID=UPI00046D4765|nr:class I SAM-dependent methyltransferase [Haloglycomyces albus]